MFLSLFPYFLGFLFASGSTFLLSYLSIATSFGPWVTPILLILGHLILSYIPFLAIDKKNLILAKAQSMGAVGGIIATGVGFSLPMLYFLDEATFNAWLAAPWLFCLAMFATCIAAGGLGIALGWLWAPKLCNENSDLLFPVSTFTWRLLSISSLKPLKTSFMHGSWISLSLCFLRDHILLYAKNCSTIACIAWQKTASLGIGIWPSLWALGYIVGPTLAQPLLIGLIFKNGILPYLPYLVSLSGFELSQTLTIQQITFAFCSGLILGDLLCHIRLPLKKIHVMLSKLNHSKSYLKTIRQAGLIPLLISCCALCGILTIAHFSFLAQLCLLGATIAATYFICLFASRSGMLPLGRFSVFVLLPLFFMFSLSPLQSTIVCIIFNICAATASDLLFDYKTFQLCQIPQTSTRKLQIFGLLVTAITLGACLWILFSLLPLGTEAFCAQRGKTKAILLQTFSLDYHFILPGIIASFIFRYFRINITMIFGGIVMHNGLAIGLTIGSIISRFIKTSDHKTIFCAGVFCAETLWIFVKLLF